MKTFLRLKVLSLAVALVTTTSLSYGEDWPEVKLSSPATQAFQKATGLTQLSGWLGSAIIRRSLAKDIKGPLDVRLVNYSASDLMHGRVKQLLITGENLLVAESLPISKLDIYTAEDTPLYIHKADKPVLLHPVLMNIRAEMTEADLNRFLTAEPTQKLFSGLKVPLPPFNQPEQMDIIEPKARFEGDRFTLMSFVNLHGAAREDALPVKLSAKIQPKKETLALDDVKVKVGDLSNTRAIERFVEENFDDLLNLNRIRVDHHQLKFNFKRTEIADGKLIVEADVTVRPDAETRRRLVKEYQAKAK
jgi:hypothetical protein